jgi:hypothetical protein
MAQAAAVISLAERLRKRTHRVRSHSAIADLRLATRYLKEFAALKIAGEAEVETDPERKVQLEEEAAQLQTPRRTAPLRRGV